MTVVPPRAGTERPWDDFAMASALQSYPGAMVRVLVLITVFAWGSHSMAGGPFGDALVCHSPGQGTEPMDMALAYGRLQDGADLSQEFTEDAVSAYSALRSDFLVDESGKPSPGVYPVHHNDSVISVLPNGEDSFVARVRTLEGATKSIRIHALIFKSDEAGKHIAELLKKKKLENPEIEITIIVDAATNWQPTTRALFRELKESGVNFTATDAMTVDFFGNVGDAIFTLNPKAFRRANQRYHEKLWIIDGETDHGVAVVGGLNFGNEYFRVDRRDSSQNWRDQDVVLKGGIIKDPTKAFDQSRSDLLTYRRKFNSHVGEFYDSLPGLAVREAYKNIGDWLQSRRERRQEWGKRKEMIEAQSSKDPRLEFAQGRMRFFHHRPKEKTNTIDRAYLSLIKDAKEEILIANAYFVPGMELLDALRQAALRGVKIRIITNSLRTNDIRSTTELGRIDYQRILELNEFPSVKKHAKKSGESQVEVWEWEGKRKWEHENSAGTLHAKYMVIDGKVALIGSFNLDPRSSNLNSESAIAVESARIGRLMQSIFKIHDLAFSRKIPLEEAKRYRKKFFDQDEHIRGFYEMLRDQL